MEHENPHIISNLGRVSPSLGDIICLIHLHYFSEAKDMRIVLDEDDQVKSSYLMARMQLVLGMSSGCPKVD